MKQRRKNVRLFMTTMPVLFLLLMLPFLFFTKNEIFLFINGHHSAFTDVFFKYWTWLGSGYMYLAIMAIMLLMKDYKTAIVIVGVALLQTIFTTVLKQLIFPDAWRPAKALEEMLSQLHFVEGVRIHRYHSFPSGHTATAFAVAGLLFLRLNNPYIQFTAIIGALAVGYSRIYLAQHFYADVYFGALAGVIAACLVHVWLYRAPPAFLRKTFDRK